MFARIERKLAEVQRWVDSTAGLADWPAAVALSVFRTRPSDGDGFVARWARRLVPHIRVRPARLRGLSIAVRPDDLSRLVIYEELFVHGAYDLDRVRFEPDLVLDCGAFEGYFSLLAHARYPDVRVIAFEPNPRNLDGLRVNAREHAAIEVRDAAVSTEDGSARFSGGGCGGRLDDSGGGEIVVRVENLCRVIDDFAPRRLLLKLDVEGAELPLLPALLPRLPQTIAMFFEWHHGRSSFEDMAARLRGEGFAVEQTRENLADGVLYIDAFAQRL